MLKMLCKRECVVNDDVTKIFIFYLLKWMSHAATLYLTHLNRKKKQNKRKNLKIKLIQFYKNKKI